MNVYLSGGPRGNIPIFKFVHQHFYELDVEDPVDIPLMESFFYARKDPYEMRLGIENYMLDSGAFTFMSCGKMLNIEKYLDEYIAFINSHGIDLFFELDVDSVLGYEKVLEMRKTLESKTSKQCIPVWHMSRGKEEYIRMCKDYDYVGIGWIANNDLTQRDFRYFPWFIDTAHEYGAKVHALGFINQRFIRKYHFDSVDSSSWSSGCRFGAEYRYNAGFLQHVSRNGKRCKDSMQLDISNFNQWAKFCRYAKENI